MAEELSRRSFLQDVLTAIWIVTYNMMSATPVPKQQGSISRPRHDVAITTNIGLRSGKASNDIPVAEHNLS